MTDSQYDLIVIGAGPGGYTAAVRAAQAGFKTVCVEKESRPGGVCLNVGCIPSKALLDSSEYFEMARTSFAEHGVMTGDVKPNLGVMMARKDKVVEDLTGQVRQLLQNNKVELVQGTARLVAADQVEVVTPSGGTISLKGKNILLATGSRPVAIPGLEFDGKYIVSSTEALSFDAIPEKLGIAGGGYIGLELGSVWRRLGSAVTVIEMLPQIAGALDALVGRRLHRILKQQGMDFRLNTGVKSAQIRDNRISVTVESKGKEETLEFDRLLVCAGRKPLTDGLGLEAAGIQTDPKTGHVSVDTAYRTNVPNIYAIGDLIPGPALAHKASAEAVAAVDIMTGKPGEVNYDVLPSVVYTWPEVACVGITEDQAKKRGIPCKTAMYPFSGVGRARCMGETEGFVKLVCHARTDRLIGAHIIGPRASELVAECALAMEFGASSEDIARTIHAHPTFSEALMEAAHAVKK